MLHKFVQLIVDRIPFTGMLIKGFYVKLKLKKYCMAIAASGQQNGPSSSLSTSFGAENRHKTSAE